MNKKRKQHVKWRCLIGAIGLILLFATPIAKAAEQTPSPKITINLENDSMLEALRKINKQCGSLIMFKNEEVQKEQKRVTLSLKEATVEEAVAACLSNTRLQYSKRGNEIIITPRPGPRSGTNVETYKKPEQVAGRVVDPEGAPLAGVTVIIKGTQLGVITDNNGEFQLTADENATLLFSCIGFESAAYPISALPTPIVLHEQAGSVDEVVVLGYFNLSKNNFTGSAVTVSGEDLKRINPTNLLKSFETFDSSFKLLTDNLAGSDPNRLPNINVRGVSSLPTNASTDVLRRDNIASSMNMPTFILDGFEVGIEKIYDLDVNRIATVTLLKDAAATAIYGSRASNGVLVITTIAPEEGKIRVSYNYELTASFPDLTSYDVLDAANKLEYERLAGVYETEGMSLQDQEELYYSKLYNVVSGVNTDWLAQPVRNAFGNKHSLYIEGGSETLRYGINGLYQTSPGVMKASGRTRYGLGVDLQYRNNDRLTFKNALSVTKVRSDETPYGSFSEYVQMNPYYPKTDEKGEIVQQIDTWTDRSGAGNSIANLIVLNPLYNATLNSFAASRYTEINDAFTAEWNIMQNLRLRGVFSLLQKSTTSDRFTSPNANSFFYYSVADVAKRGSYTFGSQEETWLDGNLTLTYNFQLQAHFVNFALGANVRTGDSDYKSFSAIGFTNDRFTDIGFARSYAEGGSPSSSVSIERLFGSFLSLNYSFNDRYLLDASFRADGSSKFGSDNKIAPFWAAGIGWNLHNEEFLKNRNVFSQLRLKANTGLTGSVSFSPFMTNTLYEYNKNNWYSTGVGVIVSQYGNSNLRWQRTQNFDIGVDLGLFNDLVYLSARYYNRLTKDMLTDITLPPSTGFSSYRDNLGNIENRGFEGSFRFTLLKNKDWNWTVSGNMSHNRNRLLKISNSLKELNDKADAIQQDADNSLASVPLLRYSEGQSVNTIYAVRSLGIDPENGQEIFVKKDGSTTYEWSVSDIVPICDATPKIDGHFRTDLYWRGWLLDIAFYTRGGGYEYNQTLVDKIENADPRFNVDSRALNDRWKAPGDVALYKNIRDKSVTRVTDRFIQRDNLIDLRSVSLSYDWKQAWLKKAGLSFLRTTITANDLWQTSSIVIERGIDYPFARSCTFSLQAIF
ncbi:MAG: SusC/RagA family TonB-linked outer membrane protein [Dysgonamonadaceae bacterium]|jgi:TonB-linked SusC/RagA family outer membrane protein|nr:SusC/RagA family TonB-linked outer membrane protein [Dysgonamonadaceae bacterium]